MSIKEDIQKEVLHRGWYNIKWHPEFKSELNFDFVDERKYGYSADFVLLIKEVDTLDKKTALEVIESFKHVEEKNPSF